MKPLFTGISYRIPAKLNKSKVQFERIHSLKIIVRSLKFYLGLITTNYFRGDHNTNGTTMKPLTQRLSKGVLLFLIVLSTGIASAATYTTMASGNWNNPAIWSVDGGVTSCGCLPPNPTAGANIEIYHDLNLGFDLDITGASVLTVEYHNGSITGPGSTITVTDGIFNINRDVDIQGLDILTNGVVNVYGYVSIQTNNSMDVYGLLNIDGGYFVANSSINVMATGSMLLNNYSKVESNAAFSNEGYAYVCGDCCVEISGSVRNEAAGTVAGSGAWNTVSGTTKNFGIWDAAMAWCSAGNDTGMPSSEDCVGASVICGLVVLSVELDNFEGVQNGNRVELEWSTSSESNNDYFAVERADNNLEFKQIGVVDGSGTTEIQQFYSFVDELPAEGKYYYRLRQVDFNGDHEYSDILNFNYTEKEGVLVGTYNLLGEQVESNYSGVVIDLFEDGTTRKRYQH